MPLSSSVLLALLSLAIFALAVGAHLRARRTRARQLYQDRLSSAVADGILSPDEIAELDGLRRSRDLSGGEVRMAARAIYRTALRDALRDARLTPEGDAHLRQLQTQLGLSDEDLQRDHVQLSRLRFLLQLEMGPLPHIQSPIPLVPHEIGHWVVQASLAQPSGLAPPNRELRSVRLEMDDDGSFRPDGERDALRPSESILPLDMGILVVTSRRIVFQGAKQTVSVPHARIEAVLLYADGIRAEEPGGASRGYFLLEDPELTAAVLLYAARRRRTEIRPARPGRSA